MSINIFLKDPAWDSPFFKRLAHNDTGDASGNQAGMVLPKELRQFLPNLDETATSNLKPTTDRYIKAELFESTIHLSDEILRYQFQTWGGTRSAESRITDGFQPIRDRASKGDIVIFQRKADLLDWFRLMLVKQKTADFELVNSLANGRRWGPLYSATPPVNQSELAQAGVELAELSKRTFEIIRPEIPRIETRQTRIARSSVFRARIQKEYGRKCAVSGVGLLTPTFLPEVESAHVVPISEGGSDDIRNGFSLTQTLHWAFDHGLFGIRQNRSIFIPKRIRMMPENAFLKQYEDRVINEASSTDLKVHHDAFKWHMENRVKAWD